MENKIDQNGQELKIAGYCGLFCSACTCYIGTHSDPARLKILAERGHMNPEDFICEGCRSEVLSKYCKTCYIKKCASEKSICFCSECEQYPCAAIEEFKSQLPHRIELYESLAIASQKGLCAWLSEMTQHYSCPECHEMNSAYDIKCRKCGNYPSNEFVKKHGHEILAHFKR